MIVIHLILTLLDAAFFLVIAGLCIGLVVHVLRAIGNAIARLGKPWDLGPPHPSSTLARREHEERRRHEAHMGGTID